jgi:putative ABC transport system substrate-binding protein
MQDRYRQLDEILLRRTAGPYIGSFASILAGPGSVCFTPDSDRLADVAGRLKRAIGDISSVVRSDCARVFIALEAVSDGMRRRDFISFFTGAVAAIPMAARAQQRDRVRRIGVVLGYPETNPNALLQITAFRQQLEKLAWIEGKNIQIDLRYGADDPALIRAMAVELLHLGPDLMVSNSNLVTTILQSEVRTTPLLFISVSDPIGSGFVSDLARPTGNITGFANFQPTMGSKWLALLRQLAPQVERAGLVFYPEPPNIGYLRSAEEAAPSLNMKLEGLTVRSGSEIENVISTFSAKSRSGLIIAPNVVTFANSDLIVALAASSFRDYSMMP